MPQTLRDRLRIRGSGRDFGGVGDIGGRQSDLGRDSEPDCQGNNNQMSKPPIPITTHGVSPQTQGPKELS
jgi:hypothetical protein